MTIRRRTERKSVSEVHDQDPVRTIQRVHAELAAHSLLKAPRHPAVGPGGLAPEDVLRELVVILVHSGVSRASIREAVDAALKETSP